MRWAARIFDDFQRNKNHPTEIACELIVEKGAGMDTEVTDFLVNSLWEQGADREGFVALVEFLKKEPSRAEFLEYTNT